MLGRCEKLARCLWLGAALAVGVPSAEAAKKRKAPSAYDPAAYLRQREAAPSGSAAVAAAAASTKIEATSATQRLGIVCDLEPSADVKDGATKPAPVETPVAAERGDATSASDLPDGTSIAKSFLAQAHQNCRPASTPRRSFAVSGSLVVKDPESSDQKLLQRVTPTLGISAEF